MNVILLSGMWPRPGLPESGIFVVEQAKELHKASCSVMVVAPVPWSPKLLWFREKWRLYGQVPRSECLGGLRVIRPRYVRPPGRIALKVEATAMELGIARSLNQLACSFSRKGVLHAHRLFPEGLVATRLKQWLGLPVVITGHGSDVYGISEQSGPRQLAREVLQAADAVVGVSQYTADILTDLGARSVVVIPNGYDSDAFQSSRGPLRFGQRIVYVGRLDPQKGVLDLLTAFAAVHSHLPSATLTYVGDGPARPRLEEMVSQRGLTNVNFTGHQPHDRIPAILREHDVFALPSYAEGLPTALVEAMAAGLAVVATPVGGIPELVAHGETGLLVAPGDIEGLSNGLRVLLSDQRFQVRLRKGAQSAVAHRYSWAAAAQGLMRVYELLVAQASGTTGGWRHGIGGAHIGG